MDVSELQQRVIAILTAEATYDADGVVELPEGFNATRAALDTLIQTGGNVQDWKDFAQALDDMKEMRQASL